MLLINEILDLSKIEAGQMSLNEGPLDLLHLIQELKNLFCMKAAQKKLSIHFELAENLPKFVVADELKLKQVLINLIDNAIKFTDNGGIYFRAEERGPNEKEFPKNTKYIFFEVEDSGPGISFEEKKDLFKAFVQTRSGQKSKQGSGLGLAISHEFVHLMKGQFQVQSTPGKGSRFSFVIPLRVVSKNNDDLSELSKNHSKMEKPVPNSGETAVQAEPNLPEEPLRAIPLDVLDELADACRSCELGKVELGIEKVRKKNPKIAAQLSELAANYSFDVIADLVVRLRNTA